MKYVKDPRVDAYIEALPDWQRQVCHEVRDLVHAADPEVEETIKRTKLPFFVLKGNVCALFAAKDHVNVSSMTVRSSRSGGDHHGGPRQQDGPHGVLLSGRPDQQARAQGDAQTDHRQQPRGWLAEVEIGFPTMEPGPLALVGSGEYLPEMLEIERELIAGRPPKYVQIPTAASREGAARLNYWVELGAAQAQRLEVQAVPLVWWIATRPTIPQSPHRSRARG
jgi:hypothetical protein